MTFVKSLLGLRLFEHVEKCIDVIYVNDIWSTIINWQVILKSKLTGACVKENGYKTLITIC